ncbi:type I restriction enzyme S subunit [Nitrosospira multiformis]|uniref:Type I restriction enzyme S subunit n=1 Tax=Nitrosospira multiformis TaxID=1231 RepID=A0A2T5IE23_9PROT|nr:restriction endonuclease subunit S [Nitrosospira multiformis]PTQ82079.1 type I restriction enzyme S subunit [Nitrosospira multiformis]
MALLEGQTEFSIIKFSQLDHIKRRIDAEFYQRRHLRLHARLAKIDSISLKEIGGKLDCSAFYPSIVDQYNFEGEGIPFLRVNEIQNGLVKITGSTAFLPSSVLESNPSTICTASPFDIIIAKGGNSLAKLGLLSTEFPKYALSRDLIVMRTSALKGNKYFIWLFLHSDFGQDLLWRTASQTGQPHLTLPSIEQLAIPQYSEQFEASAETLYEQSVRLKNDAVAAYKQAEILLLDTLGMTSFSPTTESINVKSFKDSFTATGRLDAEYYQPKYEDFEKAVTRRYPAGFTTINAEFDLIKKTSQRGKSAYNYIEIGDVNVSDGTANFNRLDVEELPANAKQEVRRGDLLISKVRPNRGAVAIIDFDDPDLIVSGAFTVLREKSNSVFSNKTLKVLLRTKVYREWMLKFNIGTQYPVIRDEDILNLPIPIIDEQTQAKIAAFVEESALLKTKSERLLDIAKRAVEIAIELNENEGIAYIEANS